MSLTKRRWIWLPRWSEVSSPPFPLTWPAAMSWGSLWGLSRILHNMDGLHRYWVERMNVRVVTPIQKCPIVALCIIVCTVYIYIYNCNILWYIVVSNVILIILLHRSFLHNPWDTIVTSYVSWRVRNSSTWVLPISVGLFSHLWRQY